MDYGIITIVGSLPDNTSPGAYKFRLVNREVVGDMLTVAANIVAVSLATAAGSFPVFGINVPEAITTSTTLTPAATVRMTPLVDTKLFIQAQYKVEASGESNSPTYDLYATNGWVVLDGPDMKRYISGVDEHGAGGAVALTNTLSANTTYTVNLRHASTPGITLYSRHISMTGFALTLNSGPLPIKLLFFNAEYGKDSDIEVKWATATEMHNDFFTLYRSDDGITWNEVAKVKGAGNSNTISNYEVDDDDQSTLRETYYKLKQTDLDGQSEEFKIISICCKFTHNKVDLYPNPTSDIVNFSFLNEQQQLVPLRVNIYNSLGQLCFTQEFKEKETKDVHTILLPKNLEPGVYYFYAILGVENFYSGTINVIN